MITWDIPPEYGLIWYSTSILGSWNDHWHIVFMENPSMNGCLTGGSHERKPPWSPCLRRCGPGPMHLRGGRNSLSCNLELEQIPSESLGPKGKLTIYVEKPWKNMVSLGKWSTHAGVINHMFLVWLQERNQFSIQLLVAKVLPTFCFQFFDCYFWCNL